MTPPPIYPDTWVAVGFSDRGDLTNADYCVMWIDFDGKFRIQVEISNILDINYTIDGKRFGTSYPQSFWINYIYLHY